MNKLSQNPGLAPKSAVASSLKRLAKERFGVRARRLLRGPFGGRFPIERSPDAPLLDCLEQAIRELRDVSGNPIETQIALLDPVYCDPKRIAQVVSNLVANAVKHGAPTRPIRVKASTNVKAFELEVSNQGDPIHSALMRQLFQPFFRGNGKSSNQGLGLGLYIASEIARTHGGGIDVASSKDETRFTLHILRT